MANRKFTRTGHGNKKGKHSKYRVANAKNARDMRREQDGHHADDSEDEGENPPPEEIEPQPPPPPLIQDPGPPRGLSFIPTSI